MPLLWRKYTAWPFGSVTDLCGVEDGFEALGPLDVSDPIRVVNLPRHLHPIADLGWRWRVGLGSSSFLEETFDG